MSKTRGLSLPRTSLHAASSHSMTALSHLIEPNRLLFMISSAVIPGMRFAPERFAHTLLPEFCRARSMMRAEVVLPFVPVTAIISTFFAAYPRISGHIFSASAPGSEVAPKLNSRNKQCVALQTTHAKNIMRFFNYSTVTDFARFLGLSISQPRSSAT